MALSEYTVRRAEALNELNIPEIESPMNIKILWVDVMNYMNVTSRSYTGIHSHAHSFYEIHFVFSGTVFYEYCNTVMELTEGQAVLIPPNVPHRYIKCSDNMRKGALAFAFGNSSFLTDIGVKHFEFPDEIAMNMDFILKQSDSKDIFTKSLISGRVLEMIYCVLSCLNVQLPKSGEKGVDSRFLVAKAYIDNNKHRMITSDDVAKECCLSSRQLNRIFKNYTGSSLFEYITDIKMKYAQKLLLKSEHSIKEIGFMLGFENECSFVSFFKRHSGMTTGEFRKFNSSSEA